MKFSRSWFKAQYNNPISRLFSNTMILLLWAWLFRPVYPYMGVIFTKQEFRTNQFVLLAVFVLLAIQVRRGRLQLTLRDLPQLHLPGLIMALIGAAAFIAAERWLDINTLSATLFGLATYGLLGLWMDPHRWRQGLPAALLLVGALPFGEHMDTFIGYPVRLVTARMVSQGFQAMSIPTLSVDTILLFENGLSQVDNPCSGVKSLWTGGLFLLAATWVEGRAVNRRWLLVSISFVFLLLSANLLRVAVLVLVGQVAGWRLLAEMLHVPLGIIGFTVSCLFVIALLRKTGEPLSESSQWTLAAPPRPGWLAPSIAFALIVLVLLYVPRPQTATAASFEWQFPAGLSTQEWPLTQNQLNWLSEGGSVPVNAARWRFEYDGLTGSLLLVASDTWRAHHRPERCFTVYGLEVQDSRPFLVTPDFPLRWLNLGVANDPRTLYSAGYWLQSQGRITEDYSARIWDDLAPRPQPWVLVTVLLDHPTHLEQTDIQALFSTLRQVVQLTLEGS